MSGILSSMVGTTQAAAPSFQSGVTSLTNASWNYATYSVPQMAYVGADSSGNPIWLWGFKDSTNSYSKCMLIRVNSDGTSTQSSVTTLNSTANGKYDVHVTTEYPDNNQGYGFYSASDGYLYVKTFSIDKDTLTIGTPSAALKINNGSSFLFAGYAGKDYDNYPCAFISHRDDGGGTNGLTLITRDYTGALPAMYVESSMGNFGDQAVFHSMLGFDRYLNGSNTYQRWVGQSYGTMEIGYFRNKSGSASIFADSGEFLSGGQYLNGQPLVKLNSSNKLAMMSKNSSGYPIVKSRTVTWPTSGTAAPTESSGSQVTLTDIVSGGLWAPAQSWTSDEFYFVYKKNSDSKWYYRKLTVSGNTITEGSAVEITTVPTNATGFINSLIGTASTSTGNWLTFITDNSSSANPDFTVVKLT
jgi:hypothetical protein